MHLASKGHSRATAWAATRARLLSERGIELPPEGSRAKRARSRGWGEGEGRPGGEARGKPEGAGIADAPDDQGREEHVASVSAASGEERAIGPEGEF